ncbi:MAG: c-type cytochrome biogenesis protein CcmI [Paracoccaceae bacterium]
MTVFILAALLGAIVTVIAVIAPLIVGRSGDAGRAARDAALYRDQLAEIDRDLARGTITPAEADGARAEISRRLLAATAEAERTAALAPAPPRLSARLAGGAAVSVPALAALVYLSTGSPALEDRPFAARPLPERLAAEDGLRRTTQAEAEADFPAPPPPTGDDADYAALVERLETVLDDRPDDARGLRLLADAHMNLGRFPDAWRTYARLIDVLGPRADADLLARQVEAMIRAARNYVSPEAERVIERTLRLDPDLAVVRFYRGQALAQTGNLAEAVAVWQALREDAPDEAPWLPSLEATLARATNALAGPPADGPDADARAAAARLSPEEREAMIEGMVAGLEERLLDQGGPPEDWVRLIRSYRTLGRAADASRIFAESQSSLDGSAADFVREQALLMGMAVDADTAGSE